VNVAYKHGCHNLFFLNNGGFTPPKNLDFGGASGTTPDDARPGRVSGTSIPLVVCRQLLSMLPKELVILPDELTATILDPDHRSRFHWVCVSDIRSERVPIVGMYWHHPVRVDPLGDTPPNLPTETAWEPEDPDTLQSHQKHHHTRHVQTVTNLLQHDSPPP
jgi:hypothetical protein